jgi:hypothetical protein
VGGPPPGPGHYARGAAGVPPPPSRPSDTGYTYVGTGPIQPGQTNPQHPGGGPSAPRDAKRIGLIALIAGAGALLLILCVGGGVLLVNNLGNNNQPQKPTTPASSAAPVALETVDCEHLRNQPLADVRNHVEGKDGFKVEVTEVDQGGRANTVIDVSPCGEQPKGSTVRLTVTTGKGRGGGGDPGESGDSGPRQPCTPTFLRSCPPSAPR